MSVKRQVTVLVGRAGMGTILVVQQSIWRRRASLRPHTLCKRTFHHAASSRSSLVIRWSTHVQRGLAPPRVRWRRCRADSWLERHAVRHRPATAPPTRLERRSPRSPAGQPTIAVHHHLLVILQPLRRLLSWLPITSSSEATRI